MISDSDLTAHASCCADDLKALERTRMCDADHPLTAAPTAKRGVRCDSCKKRFPLGTIMHGCAECEWDICEKCLGLREQPGQQQGAAKDSGGKVRVYEKEEQNKERSGSHGVAQVSIAAAAAASVRAEINFPHAAESKVSQDKVKASDGDKSRVLNATTWDGPSSSSSGYKGVSKMMYKPGNGQKNRREKWVATIFHEQKEEYLGMFTEPHKAARAYDR